jgi:hypothetical protein
MTYVKAIKSIFTKHVINEIYNSSREEPLPFLVQLRQNMHLLFCPRCAEAVKIFDLLQDSANNDFFRPSPDITERVMKKIMDEAIAEEESGNSFSASGGFSVRGWIFAGCFLLLSLSTAFFGMDFGKLADDEGSRFLLPVGITIGAVLTGYCALFIGSHLKEFSSWFPGLSTITIFLNSKKS